MIRRGGRSDALAGEGRGGFSLIEALIMLVIAGAALTIVFSVGLRSTDAAFRLGRRALDVSDRQVAVGALRTIIDGVDLPARDAAAPPEGRLLGDPQVFVASTVLGRATPCAPAGPVARMTVRVRGDARGDVLTCQADGGREAVLADLRPRRLALAYSEDGLRWRDRWEPPRPIRALATATAAVPPRARLYVRVASSDGGFQIIGRATSAPSGAPPPQAADHGGGEAQL